MTARRNCMSKPDPDNQCIATGEGYEHGCPHPPSFVVGGDLACHYHLVWVVRERYREVGHAVKVEPVGGQEQPNR